MRAPSLLLSLFLLLSACAPAAASDAEVVATAASEAFAAASAAYGVGTGDLDAVYRWSVRWRDAASHDLDAAAGHRARMATLEEQVTVRYTQGAASDMDRRAVRFYLLESEGR